MQPLAEPRLGKDQVQALQQQPAEQSGHGREMWRGEVVSHSLPSKKEDLAEVNTGITKAEFVWKALESITWPACVSWNYWATVETPGKQKANRVSMTESLDELLAGYVKMCKTEWAHDLATMCGIDERRSAADAYEGTWRGCSHPHASSPRSCDLPESLCT